MNSRIFGVQTGTMIARIRWHVRYVCNRMEVSYLPTSSWARAPFAMWTLHMVRPASVGRTDGARASLRLKDLLKRQQMTNYCPSIMSTNVVRGPLWLSYADSSLLGADTYLLSSPPPGAIFKASTDPRHAYDTNK